MQILDILSQQGGLQSIARELGVDEKQAGSGAEALLPAILGGFKKQVQGQSAGIEGLAGLLGQLGGGNLLDNVLSSQPTEVDRGNDVLGQIFGSKDVSRAVAQNAASQSGLDPALLKQMLPILAMLVAGFLAKQRSGGTESSQPGSGFGNLLGRLSGNAIPGTAATSGVAAGLGSMLDLDGDGNALDDILRLAGKVMR